ncbi:hypothetical protein ACTHGU_02050 [Chitinophagaceae bacterium MMS25-I14]
MPQPDFQQAFLLQLLSRIPATSDPEIIIADHLNIDLGTAASLLNNSAVLSANQMQHLATHYRISIDQIFRPQTDAYVFYGRVPRITEQLFETWLDDIYQQVTWFNTFSKKHITFLSKEIPFLSHLLIPELAAFKFFYWQKSILHYDSLRGKKFSAANFEQYNEETGKKIISLFNRVPSIEIWNDDSINTTLRQIDFYRTTGVFATDGDALRMYEKLSELLDHIEKQAEAGLKFACNEQPDENAAFYKLYVNSLVIGDNTLIAELDNMSITYLNHSVINYVSTIDTEFNRYMKNVLENLISKSAQISTTGSEARVAFFNSMREKIQKAANRELYF